MNNPQKSYDVLTQLKIALALDGQSMRSFSKSINSHASIVNQVATGKKVSARVMDQIHKKINSAFKTHKITIGGKAA